MKEIRLENFRCYTNQTVSFKQGINLLLGDNASGKTSVLKACKYVLSAFFSGFSDENTRWISPEKEDFFIQINDGVIAPEFPIKIHFTREPPDKDKNVSHSTDGRLRFGFSIARQYDHTLQKKQ